MPSLLSASDYLSPIDPMMGLVQHSQSSNCLVFVFVAYTYLDVHPQLVSRLVAMVIHPVVKVDRFQVFARIGCGSEFGKDDRCCVLPVFCHIVISICWPGFGATCVLG